MTEFFTEAPWRCMNRTANDAEYYTYPKRANTDWPSVCFGYCLRGPIKLASVLANCEAPSTGPWLQLEARQKSVKCYAIQPLSLCRNKRIPYLGSHCQYADIRVSLRTHFSASVGALGFSSTERAAYAVITRPYKRRTGPRSTVRCPAGKRSGGNFSACDPSAGY